LTTQKEITANLETILVPGTTRSLVKANLVRDIKAANGKVNLKLS
jgi:phosphopantetheine adenylyltransferase